MVKKLIIKEANKQAKINVLDPGSLLFYAHGY